MKKKLSLFITLALASFMATGCEALDNLFGKKEETPTEQNEDTTPEQKEDEGTKSEDGGAPEQVKVSGVVLDPSEVVLDVGEEYQIIATVLPRKIDQTVTYVSSNESICEVTDSGLVTALAGGNATVTVTSVADTTKFALFSVGVNEREVPPEPENYTVTFNANGGSGTMAAQTTNGSSYVVPACGFTYVDHKFNGWALNSASGTKYTVGSTIENIANDIVLYATWVDDSTPVTNYTVTFNENGGSGTMDSQQTNGDSFLVPSCSFSKENYNFKNWAYESKNGVEYSPGETIKNISKDITLYALWEEEQTIDPEHPDIPAGYYL